jgi:hypothetical protein
MTRPDYCPVAQEPCQAVCYVSGVRCVIRDGRPVPAPQPAQRPLSVQEVESIIAQHDYEIHGDRARYIVRMTERAHGITKGKP